MPRWITFDQQTYSAVSSRLPHEAVFEIPGRTALEYALTNNQPVVAVLPSASGDGVSIATFRRPAMPAVSMSARPAVSAPASRSAANSRPSGFLGLNDEPVYEEEPQEKKSRWKRFWDS